MNVLDRLDQQLTLEWVDYQMPFVKVDPAHLRALLDVARAAQNAREIEDYSLSEYAAMVDEHGIGGTPLQRALAPLLEEQ